MAEFEIALAQTLGFEGGFVDSPSDSGGATNFGISLRYLRELPPERLKRYGFFGELTVDVVREMSLPQATAIYRNEFWDAAPFEQMFNQVIANYVFDSCVQLGLAQGIKLLQRALWGALAHYEVVMDDGVMGDTTLRALGITMFNLLPALRAERAGLMRLIAAERGKDKEFLDGWLRRCYS